MAFFGVYWQSIHFVKKNTSPKLTKYHFTNYIINTYVKHYWYPKHFVSIYLYFYLQKYEKKNQCLGYCFFKILLSRVQQKKQIYSLFILFHCQSYHHKKIFFF